MRYIFLVITFLIIVSCSYVEVTHLSDADMKWLSGFKSNDYYFISNKGEIDTMIIVDSGLRNDDNPRINLKQLFAGNTPSFYEAFGYYYFNIEQKDSVLNGAFWIMKPVDDNKLYCSMSLGVDMTLFMSHNGNITSTFIPLTASTIELNGIPLSDCIIFDTLNSSYNTSVDLTYNKICKVIISKNCGLVYYEFENGEYFTRQFQ